MNEFNYYQIEKNMSKKKSSLRELCEENNTELKKLNIIVSEMKSDKDKQVKKEEDERIKKRYETIHNAFAVLRRMPGI